MALADFLFWHEQLGLNLGLFFLGLGVLIVAARQRVEQLSWLFLAVLALGALQSARFLSAPNLLTLGIALVLLVGHSSYGCPLWARWVHGLLTPWRPLGALLSLRGLRQQPPEADANPAPRLRRYFLALLPLAFILPLFVVLLSAGNAIFGEAVSRAWEACTWWAVDILADQPARGFFWAFFGGFALLFLVPAAPSRLGQRLVSPWRDLPVGDMALRRLQWLLVLLALNLLFAAVNSVDVLYLWAEQALPAGVNHSQFVHEGVYMLSFTTVLSGLLITLLAQERPAVFGNSWIKGLALLWIGQNLVLLVGVYLRLALYVEAFGYTPRRVGVALFLILELIGFALITVALWRRHKAQWIFGANMVATFVFLAVVQWFDIEGFVAAHNLDRYRQGTLEFPGCEARLQLNSHVIPFMLGVLESPQSADDRLQALEILTREKRETASWLASTSWKAFQIRRYRHYTLLQDTELPSLMPLAPTP